MRYTVIIENNKICWYKEGTNIRHREDGPAVEFSYGTKYWFQNDQFHRVDGPAIEFADGEKRWYQHGKFHRLDGPAIEYANGHKYWYLDGKEYSEAEFMKKTQKPSCDGTIVEIAGVKYQLKEIKVN